MSHPNIGATIIINRADDPFARVNKDMLKDPQLSWKAKGILSYLLGQKQGWKAQVADLVKKSNEKSSSVRAGIKELRDSHYAKLEQVRENGVIKGWVLRISDTPSLPPENKAEEGCNPELEKLDQENLNQGNRYHSKKEAEARTDLKQEPAPPFAAAPAPKPKNIEQKVTTDLQCDRIYKLYPRKVARPSAFKAIAKQLPKFGEDLLARQTQAFYKTWAKAPKDELRFCPHPATWFNQERFNDDPSTWRAPKTNGNHRPELL